MGIDKGDIPDLTKAPSSLLDALEQHLASLEGKKTSTSSTPSQSSRYVLYFTTVHCKWEVAYLETRCNNSNYC